MNVPAMQTGASTAAGISGGRLALEGTSLQITSRATNAYGFRSTAYGMVNSAVSFSGRTARISAYAEGSSPFAYGLSQSSLVMNNREGVDLAIAAQSRLSAVAVDPAWGLHASQLSTGDGADKIRISADAGLLTTQISGQVVIEARGLEQSRINSGIGNDDIGIEALAAARITTGWLGRADAIGLDNGSVLDSGDGDDTITVLAKADGHEANAWGLRGSRITAGAGNDTVTITATTTTEAPPPMPVAPRAIPRDPAWAMANSSVDTGEGSDILRLRSSATSRTVLDLKAYGTVASSIDTGSGNDLLEVSVRSAGGSDPDRIQWGEAYGLQTSTINTGEGDDSLILSVQGGSSAIGLDGSRTLTGSGHDTIDIRVEAQGWRNNLTTENVFGNIAVRDRRGRIIGSRYGVVGVRNITVQENNGVGIAVNNSRVESGDGDDSIYVGAIGSSQAIALQNSQINCGAGNDVVVIEGLVNNSRIDAGSGDDQVTLFGSGNATVDGGDGDDALSGGDGNDSLSGGNGNDALTGYGGNDILSGGDGDDLIDGGIGNDTLTGGLGADVFIFNSGDGSARITDFQRGIDRLVFADASDVRCELRLERVLGPTASSLSNNSYFFSGSDLLGVALGVHLTAQVDGSYS